MFADPTSHRSRGVHDSQVFSPMELLSQELQSLQAEIDTYERTISMGVTSGGSLHQTEQNILRSTSSIQDRLRSRGAEALSFTPILSSLEQRFQAAARSIFRQPTLQMASMGSFGGGPSMNDFFKSGGSSGGGGDDFFKSGGGGAPAPDPFFNPPSSFPSQSAPANNDNFFNSSPSPSMASGGDFFRSEPMNAPTAYPQQDMNPFSSSSPSQSFPLGSSPNSFGRANRFSIKPQPPVPSPGALPALPSRTNKPLPPPPSGFVGDDRLQNQPLVSVLPPLPSLPPQEEPQLQLQQIQIDETKFILQDEDYWDSLEIQQRNEEIKQVASDVIALREVFQDAANEVDVQQEKVEEAVEHTQEAKALQKSATKNLGKSAKAASAVALPAGCGAVGGVIGGVTGGLLGTLVIGGATIPGAVVGAAVGAAGGAALGAAGSTVLALTTERQMHKARLSEQWQPDKFAKRCNGCDKKFSKVIRKHHCRNCGLIFCAACTKHKMKLPGVSSLLRPRVCNKCFEALMYYKQGVAPPPGFAIAGQLEGQNIEFTTDENDGPDSDGESGGSSKSPLINFTPQFMALINSAKQADQEDDSSDSISFNT